LSIEFDPLPDNRILSEKIISRISDATISGWLKPGDCLPPERELARQFGVSRTVVREAVKTLSGRGILRVKRGAGVFGLTSQDVSDYERFGIESGKWYIFKVFFIDVNFFALAAAATASTPAAGLSSPTAAGAGAVF